MVEERMKERTKCRFQVRKVRIVDAARKWTTSRCHCQELLFSEKSTNDPKCAVRFQAKAIGPDVAAMLFPQSHKWFAEMRGPCHFMKQLRRHFINLEPGPSALRTVAWWPLRIGPVYMCKKKKKQPADLATSRGKCFSPESIFRPRVSIA